MKKVPESLAVLGTVVYHHITFSAKLRCCAEFTMKHRDVEEIPMPRQKRAKLGVVGLPSAGKTIYHTTLYDSPLPLYRPGVTLSFPPSSQRLLEPLRKLLRQGQQLPGTGLKQDRLEWELEVPETGVEWTIETMDTAGEFFASDRREDAEKVAKPVDDFLDRCDAMLYLIDPDNDDILARQLGTLRRVLSYNKRKTGAPKPIALVFTKADTYLHDFRTRFRSMVGDRRMSVKDHENAMVVARQSLTEYLDSRPTGRQLLAYYAAHCRDHDLYKTFPISCMCGTNGSFEIAPVWTHEPILWAVERVASLRAINDGIRWKRRLVVGSALMAMFLGAIGSAWGYGYQKANEEYLFAKRWCDAHPGPEHADGRRREVERFLASRPWVRRPFLSGRFLGEQRQVVARERTAHLEHQFSLLKAKAESLCREGKYPECFSIIEASSLLGEADWQPKVTEFLEQKREERNQGELARLTQMKSAIVNKPDSKLADADFPGPLEHIRKSILNTQAGYDKKAQGLVAELEERLQLLQYNRLREQLGKLDGDANAVSRLTEIKATEKVNWSLSRKQEIDRQYRDATLAAYRDRVTKLTNDLDAKSERSEAKQRVRLIDALKVDDLPGTLPENYKVDLARRRTEAVTAWEDYEVEDELLPALKKLSERKSAQKRIDLIAKSSWLDGRYTATIDAHLEQAQYDRIRNAEDDESDNLRSLCATFLEARPKSRFLEEVQKIDDQKAWASARKESADNSQTYATRLSALRTYLKIPYAKSKERAGAAIVKIQTEWDKADYKQLTSLAVGGRIQSWKAFDKAIRAGENYLSVTGEPRKMRDEVASLVKKLKAYDMGNDPKTGGVKGLQLKVVEATLSNATTLDDEDLPNVRVFIMRKLPAFKQAYELVPVEGKPPPAATWLLVSSNKDLSDDKNLGWMSGYKFFSGENKGFEFAFIVGSSKKYNGFYSTVPWKLDFGDDFFTASTGTSRITYPVLIGKDPLFDFTVKIEWKGSTLHELEVPAWAN